MWCRQEIHEEKQNGFVLCDEWIQWYYIKCINILKSEFGILSNSNENWNLEKLSNSYTNKTTVVETNSSYLSLDGSTYNEINLSKEWSIWLWHLKCNFQQYFSYIMAVSCIGGGNWSPRENHIGLSQVTDKLDHIILYRIHFAVSLNRTHNR